MKQKQVSVSDEGPLSLSDQLPTLKTLDFNFYMRSTPTFLYFDLYFYTVYAADYILCFSLTKGLRSKR